MIYFGYVIHQFWCLYFLKICRDFFSIFWALYVAFCASQPSRGRDAVTDVERCPLSRRPDRDFESCVAYKRIVYQAEPQTGFGFTVILKIYKKKYTKCGFENKIQGWILKLQKLESAWQQITPLTRGPLLVPLVLGESIWKISSVWLMDHPVGKLFGPTFE